jgi:rod shape-determining protein MreD
MKIIFPIIFVILLLFLQIGVFPHLTILGAIPNLILISILSLVILKGWKKNLGWIIAAGLFFDFYSLDNILGVSILLLIISSIIVQFFSSHFLKKSNNLSLLILFFIGIAIYEIPFFALLISIVRMLYALIFALPVFYLLKYYVVKIQKIQSQKKIF